MIIAGINLDIDPSTLQEWDSLNPEILKSIEGLLTDSRDFSHQIPVGYLPDPDNKGYGIPVKEHVYYLLQVLDRVRFKENMSITEAANTMLGRVKKNMSVQTLQNTLDRIENQIDLFQPLPPSVSKKATSNRQRIEWQRKRRIQTRERIKLKKLRDEKRKKDQEVASKAKKLTKQAKEIKMTAKEAGLVDTELAERMERIRKLKEEAEDTRFVAEPEIDKSKVIFEPTPKQAEFLAANETVVFYGGAAGGGKSYALIFDAIRYAHRPAMRSLILRRANSELKELISVSQQFYPKAFPGARYNKKDMIWTFPSGGTLEFGFFNKEEDKERYIGLPYSYIAWDEIQLQKSPAGFDFLFSRLRTTDPEITCYVRCTGNPGGAPWVKQRFIDPAPYNTTFARYQPGEEDSAITYKFIPATLFDNKYLTADGEYEKTLKQMPAKQVQQLLYGDWDTVNDGFFSFDKSIHITEDLPPMHWPIISSMDYGWVDPASCIWAKTDPLTGALYIYRELEMQRVVVRDWAMKMQEMEQNERFTRVQDRVIDWTLFKSTGHHGPSHLETLHKHGFQPRAADRNREAGWEQVNQRLLPGISGLPQLFIHKSCGKVIDQLMSAVSKLNNPNDIDDVRMFSKGRKHHWDLLDCVRYLCMARPKTITHDSLLQQSKSTAAWDKYNNYFK